MQSKHSKSRSLKAKVIAPALVVVLAVSGVVPAVTAGIHSASAASVDGETGASTTYNAPVNASNADNKNNIFWTNATYYDYLTDDEKSGGWITGLKQYGTGFNGSLDEWFPFYGFNNLIKDVANSNSSWSTPLYFGNFCNTAGAFDTSPHHQGSGWHSGFEEAVAQTVRFNYAANDSNGLNNMNQSYQGLMQNTLDANGNLMATSTLKAPYFDPDQLGSYATVINSKFPFRTSVKNGVTKYEFDSTNAKDNVYFNWNGTTPTAVNYGSGTSYGVLDGIQYFMNPADGHHSGYGIFPFNNRSGGGTGTRYIYLNKDNTGWGTTYCYFYSGNTPVGANWPGTVMSTYTGGGNNLRIEIPDGATGLVFNNGGSNGTNQSGNVDNLSHGAYWLDGNNGGNWIVKNWADKPSDAGTPNAAASENLDYGFGIKTEMNFRVPAGGVDNAGNPITFEYSGDDDLWVYITEIGTTNSQLVLDLGGNHKQAKGTINFQSRTATANDVYNKGQQTKSFTFDYTKSYKMSIFYMERGMLESNCKMAFTMVPLGNAVTVTETINTTNINSGLADAVKTLDSFRFTPTAGANGTTAVPNLSYLTETGATKTTSNTYFDLKSGGAAHFNTFFTTGDKINVTQSQASTSNLIYDRNWTYTDKVGDQGTSNGTSAATGVKQLINSTTNPDTFEFAELQADFVNTPKSAPVTITKVVTGLQTGETDDAEFGGTVKVDLGDGFKPYALAYTTSDGTSATLTSAGKLASSALLKNGRTLTFEDIPQSAKVRFEEDDPDVEHSRVSVTGGDIGITVGASGNAITVTNQKLRPGEITAHISAHKTLQNAELTDGAFEFELLNSSKQVIETKTCDASGSVTFTDRTYGEAATETFYIREKAPATADPDMQSYDSKEYKAVITVTRSELTLNANVAYSLNNQTAASAEFTNTVKTGEAYVIKSDTAGSDVSGVKFAIYKVSESGESLTGKTAFKEATTESMSVPYSDGTTKTKTAVHFTGLPLYADNKYYADSAQRTYQWYAVAETDPTTGYFKNNTVHYFQLPKQGSYDPKFEYVNGHILSPESGFGGMFGWQMAGIYAITLATMFGAAYLLYNKRNVKARHRVKK